MARRPSIVSLASSTRTQSKTSGQPGQAPRSLSQYSVMDSTHDNLRTLEDFDPDDLFARYTVSEVKAIQQRLRTNAEAKQEELRLMVGERYRDLLQASTSIISMAQSSKSVLEACHEMRQIVASTQLPRMPIRPLGGEDKHLQALQSLSAHLKLLLDAPEHLWRFMEQRKYLHAAWLFLTARAVHQTMIRGDQDSDQSWQAYGIDVSEDMPLVQRQWDTVSQFRSQIVHKATLSLREQVASPAEICAALLTLHLLESRPLTETLGIYLAQRTKTLSSLLSRTQGQVGNGHAHDAPRSNGKLPGRSRKNVMRDTRQSLQAVLELVSQTLGTARVVFSDSPSGELPLMQQVLQYIQGEKGSISSLPAELQLTTESLLTSLPSSTHFLLLPTSIRSYKPYVDGTSLSSLVPQGQLAPKLETFFTQSLKTIQTTMGNWFVNLDNAREVWDLRISSWKYVLSLVGLKPDERTRFKSVLDEVSRRHVVSLWTSTLDRVETAFREHLTSALKALADGADESISDAQPVHYLFQIPPLPSATQTSTASSLAAFQRYKSVLRRQLKGRTPLLDDVLNVVEQNARDLQKDMEALRENDQDDQTLTKQLVDGYRPGAEALCTKIADILEAAASTADGTAPAKRTFVFVGRIANELASSSAFVTTIGCHDGAVDGFRKKMHNLHDRTYQRWREHTVQWIISRSWPVRPSSADDWNEPQDTKAIVTRPSPAMIQALQSLSASMQELGIFIEPVSQRRIAEDSLHYFVNQLLDRKYRDIVCSDRTKMQDYWDLNFLRKLAQLWGSAWLDVGQRLDTLISQMEIKSEIDKSLAEHLSRAQILLAPLFPPPVNSLPSVSTGKGLMNSASLLCHGSPVVEQQFQPALDLVKASARFGLLLTGSTNQC